MAESLLRYTVLGVAFAMALGAGRLPTGAAVSHATATCTTPGLDTRQLADEITRRLRRMHVQIFQKPDLRPYDPAGELC